MFSFFKKKYKTINASEFKIINNEEITLIDVDKNELLSGIIPNSIHKHIELLF